MASITGAVESFTPSTIRVREGGTVSFVLGVTDDTSGFDPDDDLAVASTDTSAPSVSKPADGDIDKTDESTGILKFDITFPEVTKETVYSVTVAALGVAGLSSDKVVTITVFEYRQGRASGNPAAKNYGTNLLAVVAEQTDYFSPITIPNATPDPASVDGLHKNVIELRPPYTLTPTRQFYEVERLKGNPTPDPSIPGMVMGAGELNFYLTASGLGFWFKHLLQATSIENAKLSVSTDTTNDVLLSTGGTFTNHVLAGLTKQPEVAVRSLKQKVGTADATDLSDVPNGMRAAKIQITPNATAEGYKYRIVGTDNSGAPLEETSPSLLATAAGSTWTSTQHFRTVTSITRIPGSTLRTFTVGVKATLDAATLTAAQIAAGWKNSKDTYRHTFKFDSDVSEGLSIEVQEGNKDTPIRYNGGLVTRGIIRLEEVARAQFMIIANEVEPRKALHGGDVGTTLTNFERPDFDAVSAPGMAWDIPDIDEQSASVPADMRGIFRVAQMGFAADNRIAPPETAYAQDYFYPKPVRKMNRELQTQVVIDHSKEADFDQFTGGATFISDLIAGNFSYGGPYNEVRVRNKQTQLINNPTRVVQGLAEVMQQIVMRTHIGDAPDGNDDCEIFVINQEATV